MKNSQIGFVGILFAVAIAVLLVIGGVYFYNQNATEDGPQKSGTPSTQTSQGVINLSGQGLTKAPEYIFNQTETVELNLSNNSIGGALQSQVGNLKNLKVLNLSNNKFTGVPAEVGQLKNLETLNLSDNSLTGLPNELGNLSNLKFLDISGNNYSEADLAGIKARLPASTVIKTK